jgi:antitoxin VapB
MPLYIKDDNVARLVDQLARRRALSKQDAVRTAVQNELAREDEAEPLRNRLARLRQEKPLPPRPALQPTRPFSTKFRVNSDDFRRRFSCDCAYLRRA